MNLWRKWNKGKVGRRLLDKEKYKGTLRTASYDDANNVSLIMDESVEIFLLDEMAKDIAKEYEMEAPSTCDAVYLNRKGNYVIEFKNREYGSMTAKDKRDIRKKAYQTPELLAHSFFRDRTMEDLASNVSLLVVFKNMQEKEESYGKIVTTLQTLAGESEPKARCKLGRFQGNFYKEVHTIGKAEFETTYLPLMGEDSE